MYHPPVNPAQELKKGSIRSLILAVLSDHPRHGYAIARQIERQSGNVLNFSEGALYPALRAMETEGLVIGTWEPQRSGPARRIYSLTEKGIGSLEESRHGWREFAEAIENVLKGVPHAKSL